MLLDKRMEDKQLNFNQPLLSVRRYSSTAVPEKDERRNSKSYLITSIPRPPPYKSELKSGPVRDAGAVPFVWEQSPGRPKDENKLQTHSVRTRPPAAPKLPPGRLLKAIEQGSDNSSVNPTVNKSQEENDHGSQSIPAQDEQTKGIECFEDMVEEEDASGSGDDEEVFVDARDTLSRTESFFFNCSVSGISGLDDPEVKPSGTFSAYPQTRDFMIGRFLPAAKAMVSETPQHAPKKQPIILDQPRQLKKVLNGDKRPQLRYGPSFVQHYSQSVENEEESDDDYDENGNLSTKVCGLLPRFCLKGSFCLLNPLPGMSVRTRVPMSPVNRGQARSSSASSCSKAENELSSFVTSEQRSIDESQTTELYEEKIDLDNKPRQISCNSKKVEGPYSHRHSHGTGTIRHLNESSLSHEHSSGLGTSIEENNTKIGGFSSHGKGYKSFKELLADQSSSEELNYGTPAVEKTLYVDTVHKGESPHEKSCSSPSKGLVNLRGKDAAILTKGMKENLSRDSSSLEKLSIVAEGAKLQANFQKPDLDHLSLDDEQNQKAGKETPKASGLDQNLYQHSVSPENLEVPDKEFTQIFGKQSPKSHGINSEFLIPPPLPKSPSDSWLCRTLPSMSLKNATLHSHFGRGVNPRNQPSKIQSGDSKWETMVKTTKGQLHHLRYSEDLLLPIPEN